MAARNILVIEDNPEIAGLLALHLRGIGCPVQSEHDGLLGLSRARSERHDLIVLDLMLPRLDGIEICRRLRHADDYTPILMVTARSTEADRVAGLDMGADDYLTKPFHREELVARIHAIIRRSKGHAQSIIHTGKVAVNLDAKTVEVGGRTVHLTGKEYQILELLSIRKGTTLTKEMFLNHLYGGIDEPEVKIIDVFICKLRKKLNNATGGSNYIETVWGRGYVLRDPTPEQDEAPADERARAAA